MSSERAMDFAERALEKVMLHNTQEFVEPEDGAPQGRIALLLGNASD